MQCSTVGVEIWFFFIFSAVSLYLLTFRVRPFQRWLRLRRPRSLGLRVVPVFFFNESTLWTMRVLAVIPAMMLFAAILGIICFFRGPD